MTHHPNYPSKKERKEALFLEIYEAAVKAGNAAAAAATPVPMVVSQHQNMADDNSPIEKQWYVADGVCGFGWVQIKPGNSPFANWLKKTGRGRANSYAGGIYVSSPLRTQSMARNEAWAMGFAKVIGQIIEGIRVYAQSRID
jgi:hypothetical protein